MPDPLAPRQIGRIAFREEGTLWVAYYALTATMEGALFLGSIRMVAVRDHPERRQAFVDLMRGMIGDLLAKQTGGVRPEWRDPTPAPESERGGHA